MDADGNLRALTTRTDMKKNKAFPLATRDANGKLLVGAAVDASGGDDLAMERVTALYHAGCNIIVLDAQNGDNEYQIELLKAIKKTYPSMDIVAGNVVRVSQARKLLEAGADALRIGMGVGSVATTQLVKAVGRAQLSSIYACALLARQYNVPVIADGGESWVVVFCISLTVFERRLILLHSSFDLLIPHLTMSSFPSHSLFPVSHSFLFYYVFNILADS